VDFSNFTLMGAVPADATRLSFGGEQQNGPESLL